MDFLKDLLGFLRDRKKYWLIPMIIIFLLLGILIVIGGGSALAPIHLYVILNVMRLNPYQTILVIVTGFLSIGFLFPDGTKVFFCSCLGGRDLRTAKPRNTIVDHLDLGKI